jgi:hypothetical protein
MNTNNTPLLTSVCTDMLYINLQLNDIERLEVIKNLHQLCNEYGIKSFVKYGYSNAVQLLKEEQDKTIIFCIDPKYPDRSFVHLQLNPSALDKTLAKSLKADLVYLLGDKYVDLYHNSSVTRLDIAADFINLKVDDFNLLSSKQRRSSSFYNQKGETETVYLGHKKSNLSIKIYDKTAQCQAKRKYCDASKQITRIEASINPHCAWKDITKIENPFEGLRIYKLSDLITEEQLPISFCDSLQLRGLTATLRLLKPDEKKFVKSILDRYVYHDLPAKEIFEQWKLSLRKLLPLKAK